MSMRAQMDRTVVRRALALLAVLLTATSALVGTWSTPSAAASAVETTYRATGSWAVSTTTVTTPSGSYVLYHPTNLGAGGFDHPILTWGNGTDGTPSQYPGLLNHLASWGFVVVASTSPRTGYGTEMWSGVQHMISENANPASVFYQDLDTAHVGALGHSQGASGALNATVLSDGVITSTLPLHLPDPIWVSAEHRTDFSQITDPVFFVTGTSDFIISTASGQTGYYNQVRGAAAKASLRSAGHNAVQGAGTGYLGYVTAWFMYTLRGDATARTAFAGSSPELPTNSAWANQATKNLP
jgi:hypothetical protein